MRKSPLTVVYQDHVPRDRGCIWRSIHHHNIESVMYREKKITLTTNLCILCFKWLRNPDDGKSVRKPAQNDSLNVQ